MKCKFFVFASIAVLTSCASVPVTSDILNNPGFFEGQNVTACGYVTAGSGTTGMVLDRRDGVFYSRQGAGIGIGPKTSQKIGQFKDKYMCLTGTMRWSGCRSENICSSNMFDYEIDSDEF